MKASEVSSKPNIKHQIGDMPQKPKPPFRPAKDDTKPVLQDPISRADPIETEEAVLRLPAFPVISSSTESNSHVI